MEMPERNFERDLGSNYRDYMLQHRQYALVNEMQVKISELSRPFSRREATRLLLCKA